MASSTTKTLTEILRIMRKTLPNGTKDKSYQYLLSQFKENQVTSERVCRHPKAANHQAEALLCYLQSNQAYQDLLEQYKGQGERSIESSASLVGLKLPKNPE